jgi:hypothetical protein
MSPVQFLNHFWPNGNHEDHILKDVHNAMKGYAIHESLELLEALKRIEGICDNQNQLHENIWRIVHWAIEKHTKDNKTVVGLSCSDGCDYPLCSKQGCIELQ